MVEFAVSLIEWDFNTIQINKTLTPQKYAYFMLLSKKTNKKTEKLSQTGMNLHLPVCDKLLFQSSGN